MLEIAIDGKISHLNPYSLLIFIPLQRSIITVERPSGYFLPFVNALLILQFLKAKIFKGKYHISIPTLPIFIPLQRSMIVIERPPLVRYFLSFVNALLTLQFRSKATILNEGEISSRDILESFEVFLM